MNMHALYALIYAYAIYAPYICIRHIYAIYTYIYIYIYIHIHI